MTNDDIADYPEPAQRYLRLMGVVGRRRDWSFGARSAGRFRLRGRGRMHGKLLGLVTVADGTGPELDTSELVTYLNEALMVAPSMLLSPSTSWSGVDNNVFDVSLTDAGTTVNSRVRSSSTRLRFDEETSVAITTSVAGRRR